jgi:hypothetical protein
MKRGFIGGIVALVAVLAFSSSAEAHKIKLGKARAVSERDALALCLDDPTCLEYGTAPCRRRTAHIARCFVLLAGEDKLGPWECTYIDQWKIKRRTGHRLFWNRFVFENTLKCYTPVSARSSRAARNGLEARIASERASGGDHNQPGTVPSPQRTRGSALSVQGTSAV